MDNHYLQLIDFRDNMLTTIQSTFTNMSRLTFLAFSNNDISFISTDAFAGTNMRLVQLDNNSLTTLPRMFFKYTPLLQEITLYGNPWHCDCKIRYMCEAITSIDQEFYPWYDAKDRMTCTSPRAFKEQKMSKVKDFQMICTTYASALAIQLIVGLSLSAVAVSTALYVVQLYCKAKKLERNGADTGKCLA
ncbi:leucine-rich repeat neuronal protein 3-like [Diadema setosum]|uniref:leucine-rich repeat neuronal protein 3-like n=1 Tax=Diadema setosum TaxID=31175 RepID=UPI003B3B3374